MSWQQRWWKWWFCGNCNDEDEQNVGNDDVVTNCSSIAIISSPFSSLNSAAQQTAAAMISYDNVTNVEFFHIVRALRREHSSPFVSLETAFDPLRNNARQYVPFGTSNYMMFALKYESIERRKILSMTTGDSGGDDDDDYSSMNENDDYEFVTNAAASAAAAPMSSFAESIDQFENWLVSTTTATTTTTVQQLNEMWERWHELANNARLRMTRSIDYDATERKEIQRKLWKTFRVVARRYGERLWRRMVEETSSRRYWFAVSNPLTFRHSRWSWGAFSDDTFWFDVAPMLLFDLPHWKSHEHVSFGDGGRFDGNETRYFRCVTNDDSDHSRNNAFMTVCDSALLVLVVLSDRLIRGYDRFAEIHWAQIEKLFRECIQRRLYMLLVPLSLAVSRNELARVIEFAVDRSPPVYSHEYYGVNSLALDYIKSSRGISAHHYDSVQCACDYEEDVKYGDTAASTRWFNEQRSTLMTTVRRMRELCILIAALNGLSLRYSAQLMSSNGDGDETDATATVCSLRDEALYQCYIAHGSRFVASFVNTPISTREKMRFFLSNLLFGYISLSMRIMYKSLHYPRSSVRINGRPIWYVGTANSDAWLDGRTLLLLSSFLRRRHYRNRDAYRGRDDELR